MKYPLVLQKAREQGMRFLTRVKTKDSGKRQLIINKSLITAFGLLSSHYHTFAKSSD